MNATRLCTARSGIPCSAGLLLAIALVASFPVAAEDAVVVVPGILGSRLIDAQGNVVWGNVVDTLGRFGELELPRPASETTLRPDGILEELTVLGPFGAGLYESLLVHLESLGFVRGETLFAFAYDWRRSNFESARELKAFIDGPALAGKEVILVAHSMGGLVSWIYLQELDGASRVKRLITMGTPYLGSVNTIDLLVNGWGSLKDFLLGGSDRVKRVVYSFESIYELLPTYDNCCILGKRGQVQGNQPFDALDPALFRRFGWIPDSLEATPEGRAFVDGAMAAARRLRQVTSRPLPNGVELVKIAGDLVETATQAFVEPTAGDLEVREFGGDGTVYAASAANAKVEDSFAAIHDHVSIFEDEHVKVQLQRVLVGLPPLQEFALNLVSGRVQTRSGSEVPISAVDVTLAKEILEPGEPTRLEIRVLDQAENPVPDVAVDARLLRAGGAVSLCGTEEVAGVVAMPLLAPPEPGVYRIRIQVPGVGDFHELLVVLERPEAS